MVPRAIDSAAPGWMRKRLAASGRAFSTTARNPGLLRAQLAFGAAWAAEAAFTVAIGVVAFRDGGAAAVGLANVVRGVLDSLSTLLGPLLAALLLVVSSPAAVFGTSAVLSLASGLLLLGLSYESAPRGRPQPVRRIVHETVEGFQALVRYRDAGLLIGLALMQALTQGSSTCSWSSRSTCWRWEIPGSACKD